MRGKERGIEVESDGGRKDGRAEGRKSIVERRDREGEEKRR